MVPMHAQNERWLEPRSRGRQSARSQNKCADSRRRLPTQGTFEAFLNFAHNCDLNGARIRSSSLVQSPRFFHSLCEINFALALSSSKARACSAANSAE